MASETDPRLVASVELVNIRVRVVEHLGPLHGKVDSQTIAFVKRIFADLQDWHREWYGIHRQKYDDEAIVVKILEVELVYAQLWTVCVALRGVQWDKVRFVVALIIEMADDSSHENSENLLSWPKMRRYAALISSCEPRTLESI
jgi:hypothetical protein